MQIHESDKKASHPHYDDNSNNSSSKTNKNRIGIWYSSLFGSHHLSILSFHIKGKVPSARAFEYQKKSFKSILKLHYTCTWKFWFYFTFTMGPSIWYRTSRTQIHHNSQKLQFHCKSKKDLGTFLYHLFAPSNASMLHYSACSLIRKWSASHYCLWCLPSDSLKAYRPDHRSSNQICTNPLHFN